MTYLHGEVRPCRMTSQPQSKIFSEKKSNPIFLARTALRMSQEDIAGHLGLTKNYVWMLEAGRKPITPSILGQIDQLVELQDSSKRPEIVREGHPIDFGSSSKDGSGIMRMADIFERHMLEQLSAIRKDLKDISGRIEKLESRMEKE